MTKPVVEGWTEARYRTFITTCIRSGFRRFPNKYKVLKNAARGQKINKATGRMAMHYECAKCHNLFPATGVQVDHKKPVVDPKIGFVDWNTFIDRLYCSISNLQVLCKGCHKKKTNAEKAKRVKVRNENKSKSAK